MMFRFLRRELAEYRFKRAVNAMWQHGKQHCGGGVCPYFDGLEQLMADAHERLLKVTS